MDNISETMLWNMVNALYRASEWQQEALEKLAAAAPPEARESVAPLLADAQAALIEVFNEFPFTRLEPGKGPTA